MGRRERVKRAEARRASAERGGRPCLDGGGLSTNSWSSHWGGGGCRGILPHEVSEAQSMERLLRQSRNVVDMRSGRGAP